MSHPLHCVIVLLQTASGKTYTVEGSLTAAQMQMLAKGGIEMLFGGAPATPGGNGAADATVAAQAGLIPRLVRGLFDAITQADSHTSFTMSCQLIEIYQEGLRDLLQKGISAHSRRISRGAGRESLGQSGSLPDGNATARTLESTGQMLGVAEEDDAASLDGGGGDIDGNDDDDASAFAVPSALAALAADDDDDTMRLFRSAVSSGKLTGRDSSSGVADGLLQIREDPERGVFVAGAVQLPVTSSKHVFEALALGSAHRSTASTKMNERSSRSHSVFQLYITQVCACARERACVWIGGACVVGGGWCWWYGGFC
jgi:hypothetical protein